MNELITANRIASGAARAAAAGLALVLCGCQLWGARAEPPVPPRGGQPSPAIADQPLSPGVSTVIDLMEQGHGDEAAVRLRAMLQRDPDAAQLQGLLAQIERDPRQLLGTAYRERTVQRGETLAGLADAYLGDATLFYALARYNDIAVPRRLEVGQVVKIPLMAAVPDVADDPPVPTTVPSAGVPAASADDDAPLAASERLVITQQHNRALQAWRERRVDEAIAQWEALLEVAPDFQPAQVYLERARTLRQRLLEMEEDP